jgi:DNA-binding response OmpR family regulator
VLTCGDVTLDLGSLHVSLADGSAVSLTHQELRLLRTFLEHPGQVLTREQLMEQAWEFADASQRRTVDVHVRRLRVKLAASTTRITTLRGFGYRFDAG